MAAGRQPAAAAGEEGEEGKERGEEGEARAAAESEGLQLHLSNNNQTGYTGVSKIPSGRFKAQCMVDGRHDYLGTFDTAVEAAVAYGRHAAQQAPARAAGRRP